MKTNTTPQKTGTFLRQKMVKNMQKFFHHNQNPTRVQNIEVSGKQIPFIKGSVSDPLCFLLHLFKGDPTGRRRDKVSCHRTTNGKYRAFMSKIKLHNYTRTSVNNYTDMFT